MASLLRQALPGSLITWENEEVEMGRPWDVSVCTASAGFSGREEDADHLIEVKTTTADRMVAFPMSLPEIECAKRKGSGYSVYRVLGAGTPGVRVARLHDPARQLQSGRLQIFVGSREEGS